MSSPRTPNDRACHTRDEEKIFEELWQELSQSNAERDGLAARNAELKTQVAQLSQDAVYFEGVAVRQAEEQCAVHRQLTELKEECQALKQQNSDLKDTEQRLAKETAALRRRLGKLVEEKALLQKNTDALNNIIGGTLEENSVLRGQVAKLVEECTALEEEAAIMHELMEEKMDETSELWEYVSEFADEERHPPGKQSTGSSSKFVSKVSQEEGSLAEQEGESKSRQPKGLLKGYIKGLTELRKGSSRSDELSYQLRKAERRNRYLDDVDRWKGDAMYKKRRATETGWLELGPAPYGGDGFQQSVLSERRGAEGLVGKSVEEVVGMMDHLNRSISRLSADLSRRVEQGLVSATPGPPAQRAKNVLGKRAVGLVSRVNSSSYDYAPVKVVLQTFFVFWSASIIEAWYPKQPTLAEFLVDICSNLKVGERGSVCGAKMVVSQTHTRNSQDLFGEWAKDIISDLRTVLEAFGWTFTKYDRKALIKLIQEAYDLRTAMAEVTISRDVDLVLISSDTPFNSSTMVGHSLGSDDPRSSGKAVVVGTTSIGLEKDVTKQLLGIVQRDIQTILRPRVWIE